MSRRIGNVKYFTREEVTEAIIDIPALTVNNMVDEIERYCADNKLALTDDTEFRLSVEITVKEENDS